MLISKGQRAAPSAFAVTMRPKQALLAWTPYADPRHLEMVVIRYTNSTDAAANTNGIVVGRTKASQIVDNANLTAGSSYWWRAYSVDVDGNSGALATAVTAVWALVAVDDVANGLTVSAQVTNTGNVGVDNTWTVLSSLTIDIGTNPQAVTLLATFSANANTFGLGFDYRFRRGANTLYPASGTVSFGADNSMPNTVQHTETSDFGAGGVQTFTLEIQRQTGSAIVNFSQRKMTAIVNKR